MALVRLLLVVMGLGVLIYTVIAVSNDGVNLFANTLPAITEFGWPGQFHLDFATYLVLTGLWVAWRHHFSGAGIALGIAASLLGIVFLSLYLLVAAQKAGGDMRVILLGETRG